MAKSKTIAVQDKVINIVEHGDDDFICLTDMLRAKDGVFLLQTG